MMNPAREQVADQLGALAREILHDFPHPANVLITLSILLQYDLEWALRLDAEALLLNGIRTPQPIITEIVARQKQERPDMASVRAALPLRLSRLAEEVKAAFPDVAFTLNVLSLSIHHQSENLLADAASTRMDEFEQVREAVKRFWDNLKN